MSNNVSYGGDWRQFQTTIKKKLGFFELEFAKQITIFALQNHPTSSMQLKGLQDITFVFSIQYSSHLQR
jgi:hypothetical protein